jgi:choloylglycine hydrolase
LSDFPLYELRYEAPYNVVGPITSTSPGLSKSAFACTLFSAIDASGNRVMGRNFDWIANPVLVVITKPAGGYASISVVDMSYPMKLADAVGWPFDGMNERGLAIGMMAIDEAKSACEVGMASVSSFGIIRVVLDKAATVDEAIALMGKFFVTFGQIPLHYFIADRSGASATVEYYKEELRVFRGKKPWQVSTNLTFSKTPEAERIGLCWRYAAATSILSRTDGRLGPRGAFGLLAAVSQKTTVWSSAYDLSGAKLELALGKEVAKRYNWDLKEIAGKTE